MFPPPEGHADSTGFHCPRIDFMGVPMLACTTGEFIDQFLAAAAQRSTKSPLFVTYVNAACSNIAARNRDYAQILEKADGVYADGQAIVWASKLLKVPLPERVNAADFIVHFCKVAAAQDMSLYLLGSEHGVASAAAAKLTDASNIRVAGVSDGFFTDEAEAIARVKQ